MNAKGLILGVGVNDSDYVVEQRIRKDGRKKLVWVCPFYLRWRNMITRCYSESYHKKYPTYKGCRVCDEWLTFSNFKKWMEHQEWENCQLDKDLLIEGNKVYSPETCVFVHRKVNMFTTDAGKTRGDYSIGVSFFKRDGNFKSQCRNPFTGKEEYLGLFDNEIDAHLTWKKRKHELACKLAESEYCNDPRLAEALKTRYLK